MTIVTVQGPIRLVDYLVTRCVEAVVHGGDLVDPVEPDPDAQAVTAEALIAVLAVTAPERVVAAGDSRRRSGSTPPPAERGPDELASVLPVMS